MGLQFFGASNPVSRIACTVAFALGCMGSLLVLLSTLPNLLQDMDEIDTYLDQLLASGDFTTPFNSNQRGRSARIARKLGLLCGWIQSTIQCIQDAVVPVEAGTKQIGLAIRAIDKAAADQSMSTASVAAATAELELTIREVAQHLESTQAAVQETGRRAADGANVSQRATERIQELAVVVKSASTQVEALEASSSEVGAIATVIREIADQTNLLALNASIEAARAGEAGRGFAVVANEVRSLADRTTKATGKINSLIEAIKGDSDRATAGIRAGAEQVTSGVGFVHDAQVALSDINELMAEAVRRVTEITTSSSQQTEAMGEISTNIARVSAMTEQNVSVVRKTTSLIGDLAPMVDRVKQAVEQYRV
jgi:methyl-accepting chemotaxis protein